jgi:alanyl-tRNA synthetase
MKKKRNLTQIGRTEDGRKVMSGAFHMYDTFGIPLWLILQECANRDWLIGWVEFYTEATKAGWSHKTIMMRLRADLLGEYSTNDEDLKYSHTVLDRLNQFETVNPN